MSTPTPPHSAAADPAPRPHLGTPARRAPPVISAPPPAALARQRRFVLGLMVLSGVAAALSIATARRGAPEGPALPSVAVPLADGTPEPVPPWDDARVRSAAAATARAAGACVSRHAAELRALEGTFELIVHLPPQGPLDLRLVGPGADGLVLPPAFAACLAAAAAQEPFPRPIGDRQVRVPLPVLGHLGPAR